MRVRLSATLGVSGYATLLSRCVVLTRRTHFTLARVTPDATGSLTGRLGAATTDATGAVLTQFVTLLITFIGADLSEHLLKTVWQDIQNSAATTPREQEEL